MFFVKMSTCDILKTNDACVATFEVKPKYFAMAGDVSGKCFQRSVTRKMIANSGSVTNYRREKY